MRTIIDGKKSVEVRIQELERDNQNLRKENESLSSQLATVQLVIADMNEATGGVK